MPPTFVPEVAQTQTFCSWGIPKTNVLFLRYSKHKHFVPEVLQTQTFCSWGIPNTNILFLRYSKHKHFVPEVFQTQTFCSRGIPYTNILFLRYSKRKHFRPVSLVNSTICYAILSPRLYTFCLAPFFSILFPFPPVFYFVMSTLLSWPSFDDHLISRLRFSLQLLLIFAVVVFLLLSLLLPSVSVEVLLG